MRIKPFKWTPAQVQSNARSFEAALAVLAGGERPRVDPAAHKMLELLLHVGSRECDALITTDGFFVQWGDFQSAQTYFMDVAPAVLGQILEWAGASKIESEVCRAPLFIRPGSFNKLGHSPVMPRTLWLRVNPSEIFFCLRTIESASAATGWPPEIPPWRNEKVFRDFNPAITCPRCQASIPRARELQVSGGFVCPACARSFRLEGA